MRQAKIKIKPIGNVNTPQKAILYLPPEYVWYVEIGNEIRIGTIGNPDFSWIVDMSIEELEAEIKSAKGFHPETLPPLPGKGE